MFYENFKLRGGSSKYVCGQSKLHQATMGLALMGWQGVHTGKRELYDKTKLKQRQRHDLCAFALLCSLNCA